MTDLPKLAVPARRALSSAKIEKLEHLRRFTEAEVAGLHGMGPNAMASLAAALQAAKLSYRK